MVGGEVPLYETVVRIAEDYFGPAAPRYVDRLVKSHLDKPPHELTAADLPEFIEWTKLTIAMITEDLAVIDEFANRLAVAGR